MAPYWLSRRSPGGYETIDLDDPNYDDGNRLRSILGREELEKAMEGREIRMAIGCVSAAMGLYVVYRVWRDSYKQSRLEPQPNESRFSFIWRIHPAEVFPLLMGFYIFYPNVVLVGIQATGLMTIGVENCKTTGAIALPAVLALGMFHLVFGLEVTVRAVRSNPLRKAHKYRTLINTSFVNAFLLFTFIVGITLGDFQDRCFGSVGFRVSSLKVNKGIIGLLSIFIVGFIAMAGIIVMQLMRTIHLDASERIAASRMVYYLIASAIIQILLLPFFVQEYFETQDNQLTASTVAEYALFSSGAVLAFLHLFLRANAGRTAIRPRETPWQKRGAFRMFGRNDLHILNISRPINVAPPPTYDPDEKFAEFIARQESIKRKRSQRRKTQASPTPQKSDISSPIPIPQDTFPPLPTIKSEAISPATEPAKPTTPLTARPKDLSYNLFPEADEPKLPAATYSPPARSASTKSKRDVKTETPPPVPQKPILRVKTNVDEPRSTPIALGQLPAPSVTDVRDFTNVMQGFGLEPPKAPWIHRRNSSNASSATVQIGIRLSNTADNTLLPSTAYKPQNFILPSTAYQPSSLKKTNKDVSPQPSPQNLKFASGLRNQFAASIAGRDLNSFQWIDTPSDDGAPVSASRTKEYFPSSQSPTNPTDLRPGHKSYGWVSNAEPPKSANSAMTTPEATERQWV